MGLPKATEIEIHPLLPHQVDRVVPPRRRASLIRVTLLLALALMLLFLIGLFLVLNRSLTDSSASSPLHIPEMPFAKQEKPFQEELVIGGPKLEEVDPSQKSTLPLASNPAMFNEVF